MRAVGGEVGNGASYAPERCTVGELREFRMDSDGQAGFRLVFFVTSAPSPVS